MIAAGRRVKVESQISVEQYRGSDDLWEVLL